MKRKLLVLLLCVCMIAGVLPAYKASAAGNCTAYAGSNVEAQNYSRWTSPIKSYLSYCSDGKIMRVQSDSGVAGVTVEYYDTSYNLLSIKTIAQELPLFGGFYETSSNYFLLTGQTNTSESASVEVYRITKYDKNWNRLGSCGLKDCNTTVPFDAGSARFDVSGNYLLIRTCHEMYKSSDGYNHQANVTIQVDMSTMKITDSYTAVMNTRVGYVSHSFNQFIKIDGGKIVSVDHGDANPRSIVLMKYPTSVSSGKFTPAYSTPCTCINVLNFPGATGENVTGASVGGFEVSSTNYLIAGNSVVQDSSNLTRTTRNVFVAAVNKSSSAVTMNWITSFSEGDGTTSTPQLVKIGTDSYMLLWSRGGSVYYTKITASGTKSGSIYSMEGKLSDCVPVVMNNKVVWYTYTNDNVTFYDISLSNLSTKNVKTINNGHNYTVGTIGSSGSATLTCSKCNTSTTKIVPTSFTPYWNRGNSSSYSSAFPTTTPEPGTMLAYWIVSSEPSNAEGGFEGTSSNTSVARWTKTSADRGYFEIVGNGTATLTVYARYNPNLKKTYDIFVGVPKTYTITYNANGGSGAPAAQTKTHDVTLTLSSTKPTRSGYTFLGWSSSSTATTATYASGASYTGNANATLYAVWQKNAEVLTVNSSNTAQITSNGQIVYYEFTPSTTGKYVIYSTGANDTYVYLYDASGNVLDKNDDGSSSNTNFRLVSSLTAGTKYKYGVKFYSPSITGSIPFRFERVYNVSYNANGGSGAPAAQDKFIDTNLVLSSTVPTRSGYIFKGWGTSSTATTAAYQPGGNYSTNANLTLYAIWETNSAVLTANSTNTAQITTGGQIAYYEFTPSATGKYVIYSSGSDDTYVTLYDANGNSLLTDDDSGGNRNFQMVNTLTAGTKYKYAIKYYSTSNTGSLSFTFGNVYSVTYNANGGSNAPAEQEKYYGKDLVLSPTVPTRANYTFLGWSTSSTATTATYAAGARYTANANATLYAVWAANSTVLTVNSSNTASITTGGQIVNYEFTPSATGKYVIYSTGSDDTYVYLYDASGNELAKNDDASSTDRNFLLVYNLTAGTKYKFGVKYYSGSLTGNISFKFGNVYNVTYNANGGSNPPSSQVKYYGMDLTLSSVAPTRTGYTFQGWGTSASATTVTYAAGTTYTGNANAALYAVWKADAPTTYTVTYNANGGSGAPATQTKTHGVNLTLSSTKPTRTGYTFQGWGTSSTATTPAYSAGATYTTNANITLYAVWTPKTYTITFNANGGSGAPAAQTKTHGVNLTLSSTKPTRTGYTFQGWGTSASATTVTYAAGASYTGNANATLYAVWKLNMDSLTVNSINTANITSSGFTRYYSFTPTKTGKYVIYSTGSDDTMVYLNDEIGNYIADDDDSGGGRNFRLVNVLTAGTTYHYGVKFYGDTTGDLNFTFGNVYSVTYNANGGSGAPEEAEKYYNINLVLSPTIPTRSGYTFQGWGTSASATTATYAAGASYTANANATLYAVWKADAPTTYTVTYNANGGSGAPSAQTKTHGVNLTLSSTKPTRSGYTFQGWGTSASATTATYTAGASYTANANATLYAVWKANTYTVTYNANGGSGAPAAQTKTHGVNLTLSSTKPTRSGYTFQGWGTSASATTATYAAGASYTANANATLYAVWKANTYTVTYNANGGSGAPSAQTKTHGVNLTLSSTKPTRTGYTFLGWGTSASATTPAYSAGATYTANANITLYAVWGVPGVTYHTHVQSYGWQGWVSDGAMSGTSGEAKRLEAIEIKLTNPDVSGDIEYRTHVQTYGWETKWAKNGEMSGTSGEAKRLEAIEIRLTGAMAEKYDIYYRVHAQTYGWLGWAKNGESAGTAGYAKRLEGIEIRLVAKGGAAPGSTANAYLEKGPDVIYRTHVQSYGWQNWVSNGQMSGTSGEAKRLEGIEIKLGSQKVSGNIEYRTHVQSYGWMDWAANGVMSGTSGEAKRLEAIEIRLTGELAEKYDVYYRVHAETYGWLGWAKNGESAGTAGYAKRLEAIEIVILRKDEAAPGSTANAYIAK